MNERERSTLNGFLQLWDAGVDRNLLAVGVVGIRALAAEPVAERVTGSYRYELQWKTNPQWWRVLNADGKQVASCILEADARLVTDALNRALAAEPVAEPCAVVLPPGNYVLCPSECGTVFPTGEKGNFLKCFGCNCYYDHDGSQWVKRSQPAPARDVREEIRKTVEAWYLGPQKPMISEQCGRDLIDQLADLFAGKERQ